MVQLLLKLGADANMTDQVNRIHGYAIDFTVIVNY